MIAASLVVIGVVCTLLVDHLLSEREQQMQTRGLSVIRLLSTMPLSELAPASNPTSVLRKLNIRDDSADFVYATITAPDGAPIVEVAADGVLVPAWQPPTAPSRWLGERSVPVGNHLADVVEFYAPVLDGTEYAGHLRVAYLAPGLSQIRNELPFYASLALIMFLLTPLFYSIVRRETRPLKSVAADLDAVLESGSMRTLVVDTSGEFGQFISKFNQFIDFVNQRVADVETERERVVTSTKLLSYRKERVLRVLESMPDAILVMDDTGTITVVNRRLENLLGVDVSTLSGSNSLEWCENAVIRQFLSQCRGRATRRYLPEPVEFKLDENSELTYTVTAYPLFSPGDSNPIGCLVVIRDTTLQALARQGRAQFVAHVAHELKTPLNVLSMYSETLQTAEPDDHDLRVEAANVIEDEVGRLSALINNLLSLTRIEMGSLDLDSRRVRIADLLKDAFDAVRHVRGADALSFEYNVPSHVGVLHLDKDLLRIALNNLLSNAVKYNRPGGTVTLNVEETDEVLRISVSDTGIGIAEPDLPKVFDKFFRSDDNEVRDRSGHGLGLALARDIVELHNGVLSVTSEPGKGTCFTIELYREMHAIAEVG
jgi:PAS domain S-box-containing protein